MTNRSMQTPLGRVRGLGSAKEGVDHWWLQRLTAAAQVPLVLWFIISLASMAGPATTPSWRGSRTRWSRC